MNNLDVSLPSGATLHITLSPFTVSKALYQAILEELKHLKLDPNADIDANLFKDLFCAGFSSKKIDACLTECLKRVTYAPVGQPATKVTDDTWESPDARGDYLIALWEVAQANVLPFVKHLSAKFSLIKDLPGRLPK